MAFLDGLVRRADNKLEKEKEKEKRTLANIDNDQATSILKRLSGGSVEYSKKIVDNIVLFMSASGGAGASTLIANVAYCAYKKGMRVLVIDLDVLLPTQQMYFGVKQELVKPDLVDYLLGKIVLGESIDKTPIVSLIFANNRGLMDSINSESDQAIGNFVTAMAGLRSLYDLIMIDCPNKVENALCNTAMYIADTIYMVWDEGISSIANTDKIRRNMASSGIDAYTKMRIILNKRTDINYGKYPFEKLNIDMVECIPFDPDIIAASLESKIFCQNGASTSKNAGYFITRVENLTSKIMDIGGYIK